MPSSSEASSSSSSSPDDDGPDGDDEADPEPEEEERLLQPFAADEGEHREVDAEPPPSPLLEGEREREGLVLRGEGALLAPLAGTPPFPPRPATETAAAAAAVAAFARFAAAIFFAAVVAIGFFFRARFFRGCLGSPVPYTQTERSNRENWPEPDGRPKLIVVVGATTQAERCVEDDDDRTDDAPRLSVRVLRLWLSGAQAAPYARSSR